MVLVDYRIRGATYARCETNIRERKEKDLLPLSRGGKRRKGGGSVYWVCENPDSYCLIAIIIINKFAKLYEGLTAEEKS